MIHYRVVNGLAVGGWRLADPPNPADWPAETVSTANRQPPTANHFFTAAELDVATSFKLQKRRDEWLLSRYAAKALALELRIANDPLAIAVERPVLFVEGQPTPWFVSLSHSAPYAAAALSRQPVGIDVQVVREIAEGSSHLFMSDDEADVMKRCAIAHRALHFWCAKEAAWKRRSDEFHTMRQLPLRLVEERAEGLLFDQVATRLAGDYIVAITT
ncbi:MAG TPA: 4'-phosphopantetheinyl transferase superfamily protein [Thermoanaerobaculia bacterium]|nr:4'-phosphopantetheinyl transferase superfamily protein [Thermoanaerobaculia bacterium]